MRTTILFLLPIFGLLTPIVERAAHGQQTSPARPTSEQDIRDPSRPGIDFPPISGPYQVGRASYHLVDESRQEIFTEALDDRRELLVTIHYPATDAAKAQSSPYADDKLASAIAEAYHRPASFATTMHSHAVERAEPAGTPGGFPVLMFSPGFKSHPLFYTALLEELASQGFVVVSLCHPYSTGVTLFPDGRIVRANDQGTRFELDKQVANVSPRTVTEHRDQIGEVWIADVQFVATWLAECNRNDALLGGAMDVQRLGVLGHSFGGATAAAAVQRDPRFRAGINLDGSDFTSTVGNKIDGRFLWICSEPPDPAKLPQRATGRADPTKPGANEPPSSIDEKTAKLPPDQSRIVIKRPGEDDRPKPGLTQRAPRIYDGLRAPPGARITIKGVRHQTFETDLSLLAAKAASGRTTTNTGTINGQRAVEIVNSLVTGFFREQLRGEKMPWLENPSEKFPEAVRQ